MNSYMYLSIYLSILLIDMMAITKLPTPLSLFVCSEDLYRAWKRLIMGEKNRAHHNESILNEKEKKRKGKGKGAKKGKKGRVDVIDEYNRALASWYDTHTFSLSLSLFLFLSFFFSLFWLFLFPPLNTPFVTFSFLLLFFFFLFVFHTLFVHLTRYLYLHSSQSGTTPNTPLRVN